MEDPPKAHRCVQADKMPASEVVRVARLLAIDGSDLLSDVQLARRVSDGLLPRAAMALAEALGRTRVVGPVVPEATLRRVRKSGRSLSRELSERLYEVGRVVDVVSRACRGDREAIDTFLDRPHVGLADPARGRAAVRRRRTCGPRPAPGCAARATDRIASAASASFPGCRRTPRTAGSPSRARCRGGR